MVTYYVIRNKTTGLYCRGTPAYHNWSAEPRLFPSIGRLRGFITSVMKMNKMRREHWSYQCEDISQWVVDEMVLTATNTKELHQIVTGKKLMELLSA